MGLNHSNTCRLGLLVAYTRNATKLESMPIRRSLQHITDVVFRSRDEGGRSEEGCWCIEYGVEEEGTAEEKVHE